MLLFACFTLRACLLEDLRAGSRLVSCIALLMPNLRRTGTFEAATASSSNQDEIHFKYPIFTPFYVFTSFPIKLKLDKRNSCQTKRIAFPVGRVSLLLPFTQKFVVIWKKKKKSRNGFFRRSVTTRKSTRIIEILNNSIDPPRLRITK